MSASSAASSSLRVVSTTVTLAAYRSRKSALRTLAQHCGHEGLRSIQRVTQERPNMWPHRSDTTRCAPDCANGSIQMEQLAASSSSCSSAPPRERFIGPSREGASLRVVFRFVTVGHGGP